MLPYALGIDIGGTNTVYGLVDRRGQILAKGRIPTTGFATAESFIEALKEAVLPILALAGEGQLVGIGVGAPNANFFTGEIVNAPNLAWKGVIPLARLLQQALGQKVTVTNDANAAAIGEMTYGAAKGMRDFIMVTLGTGVGSGFVANGQLIYGHGGFAGELGHMIAIRDGRPCGCGRKGCLETYSSATGIVRTAREWLATRTDTTVLRAQEKALTAHMIQDAAEAGDAFAIALYEYTGKILGQTLAEAVAITAPEAIVFFGGLAGAGHLILEPTRRHMEDALLPLYKGEVKLLLSQLPQGDAAILGASALCW
jgi:glucokinase